MENDNAEMFTIYNLDLSEWVNHNNSIDMHMYDIVIFSVFFVQFLLAFLTCLPCELFIAFYE